MNNNKEDLKVELERNIYCQGPFENTYIFWLIFCGPSTTLDDRIETPLVRGVAEPPHTFDWDAVPLVFGPFPELGLVLGAVLMHLLLEVTPKWF